MEFSLTEDQRMLQDGVKAFVSGSAALDSVREVANGNADAAKAISSGLAELGLAGICLPEEHGGLGLGLLEACLIQEALGYGVVPEGFIATVVASKALVAAGDEKFLTEIASGAARFSIGLTEAVSQRRGGVSISGDSVSGEAMFVFGDSNPTHVLLANAEGQCGIVMASSLSSSPLRVIDRTRCFQKITIDDAKITVLDGVKADELVRYARLLLGADTLGASQCMLDQAVDYAKERKQFGRIIGSFQAVKHLCAEMAGKLEPARALIWHAAYGADVADEEAHLMCNLAKAHLSDVGTFVARTSTEVHGGMGFTDLLGLHYWFKRIGMNRQLLGGSEIVRADAAKLQGW